MHCFYFCVLMSHQLSLLSCTGIIVVEKLATPFLCCCCVWNIIYIKLADVIQNNNLAACLVTQLSFLANISSVTWVEFPASQQILCKRKFTHTSSQTFTWRQRVPFLEVTSLAGGIGIVLLKLIDLICFRPGKHVAKVQFSLTPI